MGKGTRTALVILTALIVLICIYCLSFTFKVNSIESKAVALAEKSIPMQDLEKRYPGNQLAQFLYEDSVHQSRVAYKNRYLDSISNEKVYLWNTFKACKEQQLNLGLDLQGGMSVVLQVSLKELLQSLADKTRDPKFNKALELAEQRMITSNDDYVTLFIKAFRELMRIKNILTAFADFKWEDLAMAEQLFEDYKSKYLDLYDKVKSNHQKEKVSILEDVDFELELIHRDEINVNYIIQLLIKLKASVQKDVTKTEKEIFNLLNSDAQLRSKRELIEKFIQESLPVLEDTDDIPEAFDKFWNEEQQKAFKQLVKDENLSADKTEKIIEDYLFAEREPLRDEVLELIEGDKPTVLERKKVGDRILSKILGFVETFINGMTGK